MDKVAKITNTTFFHFSTTSIFVNHSCLVKIQNIYYFNSISLYPFHWPVSCKLHYRRVREMLGRARWGWSIAGPPWHAAWTHFHVRAGSENDVLVDGCFVFWTTVRRPALPRRQLRRRGALGRRDTIWEINNIY